MIDDQLFLETLLMEIRGKTISYSSYKKKVQNRNEDLLRNTIQQMEEQDQVDIEELDIKKKELENIRIKKVKGSVIRSRARWQEEGEKPTKYFFQSRK